MFSFSSDSKYFIITDGFENWKLEKNQVSFKWVNELVIIDRNGMHYKNIPYTEIVGGFASASQAVSYLETLVNTGQTVSIDTSLLATKDNQTNGNQLTQITDGAGTVNTKQLGTQLVANEVGLITQSVIHGLTTGGGGGYVDVKVNPSGALTVDATISGTVPVSAVTLPLPTGAATSANQTTANNYLAALNSLTPSVFDYISLTYTLGNVTTVVYKNGGAGGTTISTLTLAYDGSGNLTSVTKT